MLRPAERASTIDLTQKKTDREMRISIHPDLDRIIKATPANGVYLFCDATGRKLTHPALTRLITRAVQDAGLPRIAKPMDYARPSWEGLLSAEEHQSNCRPYQAIAASPRSSATPKWPNRRGSIGRSWPSSHGLLTFSKFLLTSKNRQ